MFSHLASHSVVTLYGCLTFEKVENVRAICSNCKPLINGNTKKSKEMAMKTNYHSLYLWMVWEPRKWNLESSTRSYVYVLWLRIQCIKILCKLWSLFSNHLEHIIWGHYKFSGAHFSNRFVDQIISLMRKWKGVCSVLVCFANDVFIYQRLMNWWCSKALY